MTRAGAGRGQGVVAMLPTVLCVVAAVCVAALMASGRTAGSSSAELARGVVAGLAFGLLGSVVVRRARGRWVGWLMLVVGLSNALSSLFAAVAHQLLVGHPGDRAGGWVYWLGSWTWVPGYTITPALLLLLLPTGAPLGSRWRWWVAAGTTVTVLATVGWATTPYDAQDTPVPAAYGDLHNPVGVDGAGIVLAVSLPVLAACTVAGLISLVLRMRRRSGRERAQVAWVLTGALATVALLVGGWVIPGAGPTLVTVAMLPIPLSVAWAMLTEHLADLDAVVNKGLLSAALLAGVVVVYTALVGVAGHALRDITRAPDLTAFLVAAAVVQPFTFRAQRRVNRVLYGQDLEPHLAVARLGEQLQSASSPRLALHGLVETVAGSLGAPYAALRTQDGLVVASTGSPGEAAPDRMPLTHQGRVVGHLELGAPPGGLGLRERELLEQLTRHAALAVHGLVLQQEVQRSRERIVGSREEERRRLRHDLHDDLGPGLAATALELETAAEMVEADPGLARGVLERAAGYLRSSVADVRRIVDDLRPVALGELGLEAATREHAARLADAGLSVVVTTTGDLDDLPAAAEVAAYRIATEAMTNVVRHARATSVEVCLTRRDSRLEVRVSDDGIGLGDALRVGVGLDSMHQRAAELGGRCVVAEDEDGGTTVLATMPVEDR